MTSGTFFCGIISSFRVVFLKTAASLIADRAFYYHNMSV